MSQYTLSKEEQDLINIISHIGCLTTYQCHYVLDKFMKCSLAQESRILQNLSTWQYITISNNKNFITAGDRKTKYGEKIDLKKIRAFQLCLDLMDSFENLKYSHIPDNNMDLTFLANGKIYYVMNVSMAETFKINFAQQLYDKEVSSHISKKGVPVPYITIFLFSSTENEDDILEYFNSENIRIPCLVVISKSDGIQDKLVYDLYELNA